MNPAWWNGRETMKKTNRNQLPNPGIFFLMIAGLLILSCSLQAQPGAAPTTAAQPASGNPANPGGPAVVSVSEGVFVLTPGQPYPTPQLDLSLFDPFPTDETEVSQAGETPSPAGTPDVAALGLPAGLSIYPGATALETSAADPSGTGLKYVTFHTSDTPDQVRTYYNQELTQAGWQSIDQQPPTPDANGHLNYGWMTSGWLVTVTPDVDPQGGSQVMLTWMKL